MERSHVTLSTAASVAASDAESERDTSAGTRVGEFTLLRRLGRGAQGDVYEARQESLGRLVALKVLPPYFTFHPDRVQRFRREAEAGGRLAHPNTVAVHSVGESDGCHYIVQELVAGGRTLADRIATARAAGELPKDWFETMAALLVQVCEAVHAAHEAGIIHRDIKPGNILLTADGKPKVADFGLAMIDDDLHRSRSGELIGTPFYMSPEQAAGQRSGLDRRTDVFSLGTTLYEALTLQRPFEGETREGVVEQIRLQDPPDPRKLRGAVPVELALICLKALEKRRERRYQSAGELASDLNRYLRHEPIVARRPNAAVRAGKWLRRHPVRAGFAAAFVLQAVMIVAVVRSGLEARREGNFAKGRADRLNATLEGLVGSLLDPLRSSVNAPLPVPPPNDPNVERIDEIVRIANSLEQFPEERWYLLVVAGANYRNVSLFDRAEACLVPALELARLHAATDPEAPYQPINTSSYVVARSTYELGRLRHWSGDLASAEPLLKESRELAALVDDDASLQTWFDATVQLAQVLTDGSRLSEAETLLTELDDHPWDEIEDSEIYAVQARELLGRNLLDQGRLDEAAERLVPLLPRSESVYSKLEWTYLAGGVALLHDMRGREAHQAGMVEPAAQEDREAERLYREALAQLAGLEPAGGLRTADLLNCYGSFLSPKQRGRIPEAVTVLEQGLDVALRTVGDAERVTAELRNNLATAYYRTERQAEAEALWRAVLETDRRAPLTRPAPVLMALQNLSALCRNANRLEEAEQLSRELVERTPASDPKYEDRRQKLQELEGLRRTAPSKP